VAAIFVQAIAKGVMADLPDLSSPAVRASVLQLEAMRRERQKKELECLRECFDLIAGPRLDAQGTLSAAEINHSIPEMVLEAAVEFGWIPYPRQQLVQRRRPVRNAWIPGSVVVDWVSVPIPDDELVENLGRFKVEAGFTAMFLSWLAGRIAHWQGEALIRASRTNSIVGFSGQLVPAKKNVGTTDPNAQGPEQSRMGKKPVRPNKHYRAIDRALREIAESRPETQEEIFQALEGRVPIPRTEPFVTARGWITGFHRDEATARSWLSKRWRGLDLPPLPRGPKNSKE
jgi:hypothetical protein